MGLLVDSLGAPLVKSRNRFTSDIIIAEAAKAGAEAVYSPYGSQQSAAAASARADIRFTEFVKEGWPVIEPGRRLRWNWHIDAICEHLEAVSRGDIKKLIINIPPRHMKSLLVAVLWLAWEWTWMPWSRWIFASYAEKLSKRDSVKTRRIIQSNWYRSRWGHVYQLTSDQNEKMRYENDRTGYRIATSVGGGVIGEGGDRIIFDDPHKAGEIHSETKRVRVLDWWDEEMSTRVNDPETASFVGIMQRLHEKDLAGHLLSKGDWRSGGWEHLVFPAEYEPPPIQVRVQQLTVKDPKEVEAPTHETPAALRNWSDTSLVPYDPRTKPGSLLWPERFTKAYIDDLKIELGSFAAAGQLQQRPAPAEGGIFKRQWWVFWQPNNVPAMQPVGIRLPDGTIHHAPVIMIPLKFDFTIQSWDLTFKDTISSAFVVGQYWGSKGALRFLLDQTRAKLDFTNTVKKIREFRKSHPEGAVYIEDKANGPAVMATLRTEIAGIVAVDPEGDKTARAWAEQPYVEAGNVVLPHPSMAPWVWDLIEEGASFPASAYKDQVDTMTQALLKMRKRVQAEVSSGEYTRYQR